MAGEVLVEEQVSDKPGKQIPVDAVIRIKASPKFVSRAGVKLEAALDEFKVDVSGRVAIDVGASTGGFTDCLLQRGVRRVYAIDVGYGQLAWKIRTDSRVEVVERTNIRYLDRLPTVPPVEPDLATIDVSFISLKLVLPPVVSLLNGSSSTLIALIKPQFEAGKQSVGRRGVVRDRSVHRRVLEDILAFITSIDLVPLGLMPSPIVGSAGNIEFLLLMGHKPADYGEGKAGKDNREIDANIAVASALDRARSLH